MRPALFLEAISIVATIIGAAAAFPWSPAPLVYVALVVAGVWVFPLVTVYIPHDSRGKTPLTRTRLFR
jgi:hypothetical protein